MHVPAPVIETVEPTTVQTPALPAAAEKTTARPELAVALTAYVAPPTTAPEGAAEVNVTDCALGVGAPPIENDCCACGAAL